MDTSTQHSTANAGTCNYGFYLNVQFIVFVWDVYNDDVRSSGCIVSNGRIINELWISIDVEVVVA